MDTKGHSCSGCSNNIPDDKIEEIHAQLEEIKHRLGRISLSLLQVIKFVVEHKPYMDCIGFEYEEHEPKKRL